MNWRRLMGPIPRPRITDEVSRLRALHCSKGAPLMSALGLGRVKAPTLAARVETSRRNCIPESQVILHTRGVMPSWRIVFSTFRDCMSFYTARVKLDQDGQRQTIVHVRFAPKADK